jgi:16S rRNA (guanine966-N2)-methyltransferase
MRITGGLLRGRRVLAPTGAAVRPTQDRVREALFSSLAGRIPGARFLDLFAGCGTVGLEAWSRGASAVWWVEQHPSVARVLAENLRTLAVPAAGRVVNMDALAFLRRHPEPVGFDIVFADPPYGTVARRGKDVAGEAPAGRPLSALLAAVADRHWLAENGVFVLETSAEESVQAPEGWVETWERRYGSTRLRMYGRGGGSAAAPPGAQT